MRVELDIYLSSSSARGAAVVARNSNCPAELTDALRIAGRREGPVSGDQPICCRTSTRNVSNRRRAVNPTRGNSMLAITCPVSASVAAKAMM